MWEYEHRISSRSRSIRVSILPGGKLRVTTPKRFSQKHIEHFLHEHTDWIKKHVTALQTRPQLAPAGSVSIFGKIYQLTTEFTKEYPIGVRIVSDSLIVNTLNPNTPTNHPNVKKQLNRFLKLTATHYLTQRTAALAVVMKTTYTTVTLREQSTRWGSCSSKGSLNFNWRLVHFPTEIIDYVIIHELAHRTHLNHSASFWNLVAQYDPEHTKHRGWLKRNGQGYNPDML